MLRVISAALALVAVLVAWPSMVAGKVGSALDVSVALPILFLSEFLWLILLSNVLFSAFAGV